MGGREETFLGLRVPKWAKGFAFMETTILCLEKSRVPSPSAVATFPPFWLWLLLIALAGGGAVTALPFRRRRMRSR